MELTAAAEKKRRELLEKELEKHSSPPIEEEESWRMEVNEYVSKYLETLEVRSASSTTDSGYRTGASSVVCPSEYQTEDPGKKSGRKLLCVALYCAVRCCAVLCYLAMLFCYANNMLSCVSIYCGWLRFSLCHYL